MVAKGAVLPNHIPVNNFELRVQGGPKLLFVTMTTPEQETETIDLPDRTQASGGNVLPSEAVGTIMAHHVSEVAYLEQWRKEGIGAVSPTYKRTCTLVSKNIQQNQLYAETWIGVRIKKIKKSDRDLADPGAPVMYEYTFGIDDIKGK